MSDNTWIFLQSTGEYQLFAGSDDDLEILAERLIEESGKKKVNINTVIGCLQLLPIGVITKVLGDCAVVRVTKDQYQYKKNEVSLY